MEWDVMEIAAVLQGTIVRASEDAVRVRLDAHRLGVSSMLALRKRGEQVTLYVESGTGKSRGFIGWVQLNKVVSVEFDRSGQRMVFAQCDGTSLTLWHDGRFNLKTAES